MIVYITGIAGFLGSHVANQLLLAGHTVLGCDNMLTGKPDNVPDGAVLFVDDIRTIHTIPKTCDVVVHTAAIARSAWPSKREIHDVNVNGTWEVVSAAREVGARIVYCSSCVAAVPGSSEYALSKLRGERVALMADATALRYSNIYGKGQSRDGPEPNVLASWQLQAESGRVRVDGRGTQTRDFLHVRDAAWATCLAVRSKAADGMWLDICTGTQTPIIQLARRFNVAVEFAKRRSGDPDSIPQDPKRAMDVLGFTPDVGLEEGIREILK